MAETPDVSVDTLVIACGNPMRGDDGVGPIVAEQAEAELDAKALPDNHYRFVITHQILPEHALELSQARRAVLIDARVPDGEPVGIVSVTRAQPEAYDDNNSSPSDTETGLTHHWTLPRLLAMAEQLFGQAPEAYIVSISTDRFDQADQLSAEIADQVPAMKQHVLSLVLGG